MRYVLFFVSVAMLSLVVAVGASVADPNLPNIFPHRHFIVTATGELVQVGPRVCDDPALQHAFNEFHSNTHVAVAGSPGPTVSAPGLHNGYGAELTSRSCAFTG